MKFSRHDTLHLQMIRSFETLLAKAQPARYSAFRLGCLLVDLLIEAVCGLFQFFAGIVERLRPLIFQLIDLGTGLVHLRRDHFISLADVGTYIVHLENLIMHGSIGQ